MSFTRNWRIYILYSLPCDLTWSFGISLNLFIFFAPKLLKISLGIVSGWKQICNSLLPIFVAGFHCLTIIKTIQQIKSRIKEVKDDECSNSLAKIQVCAVLRAGDIRRNVLFKCMWLCMETSCSCPSEFKRHSPVIHKLSSDPLFLCLSVSISECIYRIFLSYFDLVKNNNKKFRGCLKNISVQALTSTKYN